MVSRRTSETQQVIDHIGEGSRCGYKGGWAAQYVAGAWHTIASTVGSPRLSEQLAGQPLAPPHGDLPGGLSWASPAVDQTCC